MHTLLERENHRLLLGKVKIHSNITWEEDEISFVVLYLGDYNLTGSAKKSLSKEEFRRMSQEIEESFKQGKMEEVMSLFDKYFGYFRYSLWHLFKDTQRKVIHKIFDSALKEINTSFKQIYHRYAAIMQITEKLGMPVPKPFLAAAEFVLNTDIRDLLESEEMNLNKLIEITKEIKRFSINLEKPTLAYICSQKINMLMEQFLKNPENPSLLEQILEILRGMEILSLDLNLWKAQNIYFFLSKEIYPFMSQRAEKGDEEKKKWIKNFHNLSNYLKVKIG
jgi:hypothetical protein